MWQCQTDLGWQPYYAIRIFLIFIEMDCKKSLPCGNIRNFHACCFSEVSTSRKKAVNFTFPSVCDTQCARLFLKYDDYASLLVVRKKTLSNWNYQTNLTRETQRKVSLWTFENFKTNGATSHSAPLVSAVPHTTEGVLEMGIKSPQVLATSELHRPHWGGSASSEDHATIL